MNSYSSVYSIYDFNPFVKRIFLIAFHRSVHKQNKKSSSCLGVTKGRMKKSLKKSVIKR